MEIYERATQTNGVQIHTQTSIKLKISTPIPHQQTTAVKSECDGVNIKSISVTNQVPHFAMVWCLRCQSHVEHWSFGSLDSPLNRHNL